MLHKRPMKGILFWILWLWGIKQYCSIKKSMSVHEEDTSDYIFVIWNLCKVGGCRKPLLVLGVLCERSLWSQPNCIDSCSLNNSHYSVCQLPQKMGTEWVQPISTLSANHPLRVKTDTGGQSHISNFASLLLCQSGGHSLATRDVLKEC